MKNIIIGILGTIVLVESYFLFLHKPQRVTIVQTYQDYASEYEPIDSSFPEESEGRIALIIDDWGYSYRLCKILNDIDAPLAVSILPGLRLSTKIAQCANNAKKDVMIHLPLEPHVWREEYPRNYVIETSMSSEKIAEILLRSIKSVPYVQGVNNHMGSKATEDSYTMKSIFTTLKNDNLFFVDSLVTSNSVCEKLAKEMQLPFIKRDVFLDNTLERSYIENQFKQLAKIAKKRGFAIGIGHASTLTLQVAKEQINELKKQGFQFVSIKDLVGMEQ